MRTKVKSLSYPNQIFNNCTEEAPAGLKPKETGWIIHAIVTEVEMMVDF